MKRAKKFPYVELYAICCALEYAGLTPDQEKVEEFLFSLAVEMYFSITVLYMSYFMCAGQFFHCEGFEGSVCE